jgi:type VI secretion system Hcp family effector
MAIKGQKQGVFRGEATDAGRRGKWTEVVGFQYGTETPVDSNGGLVSGHRRHKQFTITKENGVSSPQLLNAHLNAELCGEVVIQVVGRPSSGGSETIFHTITLTNATITGYHRYVASTGGKRRFLENYVLEFEDIDFRRY